MSNPDPQAVTARGVVLLHAWALASLDGYAKAYDAARAYLTTTATTLGADFIVAEVIPAAVRSLAKWGAVEQAEDLLASLAGLRFAPKGPDLETSHGVAFQQLQRDLATHSQT